ncbi:MAG: hypothetical protein LBF86_05105 [Helicobacteraceae bacterium]|nr:hypothetical protein [Helicobacteraceae bacterium]
MEYNVNRLVAEYNDKTQSPNEGDQKVFAKDRWIDAKEWEIENLNDTKKRVYQFISIKRRICKIRAFQNCLRAVFRTS